MEMLVVDADPERKAKRLSALPSIKVYAHCVACIKEKPDGIAPRHWARHEIGYTAVGIQIWCIRHDINVAHIDFEGNVHPANCDTHIPATKGTKP